MSTFTTQQVAYNLLSTERTLSQRVATLERDVREIEIKLERDVREIKRDIEEMKKKHNIPKNLTYKVIT